MPGSTFYLEAHLHSHPQLLEALCAPGCIGLDPPSIAVFHCLHHVPDLGIEYHGVVKGPARTHPRIYENSLAVHLTRKIQAKLSALRHATAKDIVFSGAMQDIEIWQRALPVGQEHKEGVHVSRGVDDGCASEAPPAWQFEVASFPHTYDTAMRITK